MSPQVDVAGHPARLLVVDDEPRNRELLTIMLTPDGFEVRSAAGGEEALAMVAGQPPDLILLDIMMPGMDGYRVAAELKGSLTTKHIPIIMVTALDDHEARMSSLSVGVEEFLTKPVDRAELCARVRNLLRLKAHGDYYEQRAGALTEQATLREALEEGRKEQMRFKDEFLSHVSHELRSPLTAIKQFTTILLGGLAGELNKEQHEYLQIVLKNIQQLQSMIDDLLEVTRLETGKLTVEPESVSISAAVTDTLNTLQETARAKGVTLSSALPPGLPPAHADPTRLRQILIILLDNAIKFTPDGGVVRVHARLLPHDPRFVLLEVADTGCGLTPEVSESIFERHYQVSEHTQSSRKGLGLGLYIGKELVARQGGHMSVSSKPRHGSTFSFTLPVFSLGNLIAPLLKGDKWPADSVAIVVVEMCRGGEWLSKESQDEWSREARNLLQRCLLPDLDVCLPQRCSRADGERFLVAAFADEQGASVLANRIREQFDRHLSLKQTGLTITVTYSVLQSVPSPVGASVDDIVTSMATSLEEVIASHRQLEVSLS